MNGQTFMSKIHFQYNIKRPEWGKGKEGHQTCTFLGTSPNCSTKAKKNITLQFSAMVFANFTYASQTEWDKNKTLRDREKSSWVPLCTLEICPLSFKIAVSLEWLQQFVRLTLSDLQLYFANVVSLMSGHPFWYTAKGCVIWNGLCVPERERERERERALQSVQKGWRKRQGSKEGKIAWIFAKKEICAEYKIPSRREATLLQLIPLYSTANNAPYISIR